MARFCSWVFNIDLDQCWFCSPGIARDHSDITLHPGRSDAGVEMAIYRLIADGNFDPDAVKAMTVAYEAALDDLGLQDRNDPLPELLAKGDRDRHQHRRAYPRQDQRSRATCAGHPQNRCSLAVRDNREWRPAV